MKNRPDWRIKVYSTAGVREWSDLLDETNSHLTNLNFIASNRRVLNRHLKIPYVL